MAKRKEPRAKPEVKETLEKEKAYERLPSVIRQLSDHANKADIANLYSYVAIRSLPINCWDANGLEKEARREEKSLLEDLMLRAKKTSKGVSSADVGINIANMLLNAARDALSRREYLVYDVQCKTSTRLLIGLATQFGKPAFDIGLSFHPVLGIPYIPASSIKGSIHSYVNLSGLKCSALGDETEQVLFGSTLEVGHVIVTDAYPVSYAKLLLEAEVITPIYSEAKKEIKEHEASPVPIIYPCIAKGVTFRFIIALDRKKIGECAKEVLKWIESVLKEGIGAKTMLGYGIMEGISVQSGSWP